VEAQRWTTGRVLSSCLTLHFAGYRAPRLSRPLELSGGWQPSSSRRYVAATPNQVAALSGTPFVPTLGEEIAECGALPGQPAASWATTPEGP
jgi:hypothetical protein